VVYNYPMNQQGRMEDIAQAMSQGGCPVYKEKLAQKMWELKDDRRAQEHLRALLGQVRNSRIYPQWKVVDQFWEPSGVDLWALVPEVQLWSFTPSMHVGSAVILSMARPYILAVMAGEKSWLDIYHHRRETSIFDQIAVDLKVDRQRAKDVFYRFLYHGKDLMAARMAKTYPWFANLRAKLQAQALRHGAIETPLGTTVTPSRPEIALWCCVEQTIKDVLRTAILKVQDSRKPIPYAVYPDWLVVPESVAAEYAKATQEVGGSAFRLKVSIEHH
jgi:hypothetical protein